MRSFALIEDGRATILHVRHDGDVTVFDRDRESPIRFRIAIHADGDTTWRMLSRVMDGLVRAEDRLIRIEHLVERVKAGWRPVADEIDSEIPQRTLRRAPFAFPDDPDDPDFYAPPTKLLGIGSSGYVEPTGHILWIDAYREWAVCDDGLWWTPPEDR